MTLNTLEQADELALTRLVHETLWRVDRAEFPVGYASPVLWESAGRKQVVLAGTLRVAGYDLETGQEVWTVRGMSRVCNLTPTVGPEPLSPSSEASTGAGSSPSAQARRARWVQP